MKMQESDTEETLKKQYKYGKRSDVLFFRTMRPDSKGFAREKALPFWPSKKNHYTDGGKNSGRASDLQDLDFLCVYGILKSGPPGGQ